jgi:hypothetical protein
LLKILGWKWRLAFKVIPLVGGIVLLKFGVHFGDLEFLSLNSLFTAIISANIFLIGFLISGVLADYKESERLPGEMAVTLEAFVDDVEMIEARMKCPAAGQMRGHLKVLAAAIIDWFHKKEKTSMLFENIRALNDHFAALEATLPANYIVRLKNEQSVLRKQITRIHTIRETSFNPAGYAIAEILTFVLVVGLIFVKIDPYYESIFFVAFVSFILTYMIKLINALDNPFSYYENPDGEGEVSLKPLYDLKNRIGKSALSSPEVLFKSDESNFDENIKRPRG